MSLFTKTLSEIRFADIEDFCRVWPEGVRVEYKQTLPKDPRKTISAFANTMGGVCLIGVKAKDGVPEMPITGMKKVMGIEETITQSSITGIYPSVLPEVRTIEVPDKEENVVVVIRVSESLGAPHAIQNSTRVYVRTGSISQPHELAEIDRLEYLLKRRETPSRKKTALLRSADHRVRLHVPDPILGPTLKVTVIPVFPHRPIVSQEKLYLFAQEEGTYGYISQPVRVLGGVIDSRPKSHRHMEMNEYGLVYFFSKLEFIEELVQVAYELEKRPTKALRFPQLVGILGKVLKIAEDLYESCQYLGNVEISVILSGIRSCAMLYEVGGFAELELMERGLCVDDTVSSSRITLAYDPVRSISCVLPEMLREIAWVFQLVPANLDETVQEILVQNRSMQQ
ncbi:MAG: ATP-binding protein [Candidatus Eisenbacteria bacterium]|nr:ATP-binding protein [Candidatus Eisenbacteria bacterium]